jgi:hypothetical protein
MGLNLKPTFPLFRILLALSLLFGPILPLSAVTVNELPRQQPLLPDSGEAEFRVAIIGAGIAGASAAFHIHNESASNPFHGRPVAITIFESSASVGGKVHSVFPPGQKEKPLELGASSFWQDDWCMMNAADATQTILSQTKKNRQTDDGKWIVDGSHLLEDVFCEQRELRLRFWTWREAKKVIGMALEWARFEMRYRFSMWRIRRMLKLHMDQFYEFGRTGTFDNVVQELERCGLGSAVRSTTASASLESLGMSRDLQRTLLEPCVKETYGLSMDEALGLHAVLAAGAGRSNLSVTATDGNQKFVKRIIEMSGATLRLKSRVVRVAAGSERRYALTVTSEEEEEHPEFDAIITTGEALQTFRPRALPNQHEHRTTYKTVFSSEYDLDPRAMGLKTPNIPRSILFATSPNSTTDNHFPFNLTSLTTHPAFYIDRTGCSFDDECDQYVNVYIAESTSPLSVSDLRALTRCHPPIVWSETHPWQRNMPVANSSDPYTGDIRVEDFFLDAVHTVVESMEMSCRMGRNVALKIMERGTGDFGESSTWTEGDLLGKVQGLL